MQNEKICEACGVYYTPTSPTQKYCPACGKNGGRIRSKIERRISHLVKEDHYYNPTIYTMHCETCGKEYRSTSLQRKFCSKTCRLTYEKKQLVCTNCGKHLIDVFPEIPDSELNHRNHFCSETCKQEYKQKVNLERYGIKTCLQCGKTYSSSNEKFCSKTCMLTYRKAHKTVHTHPIKQKPPISPSLQTQKALQAFREKQKHQIPAAQRKQKQQEAYIHENGLCSICKTPYQDCERMTSGFRIIPKGAHYDANGKIKTCPKYTPPNP